MSGTESTKDPSYQVPERPHPSIKSANLKTLAYNILMVQRDPIVKDKEIPELEPCSRMSCIEKQLPLTKPGVCPFSDCGANVESIKRPEESTPQTPQEEQELLEVTADEEENNEGADDDGEVASTRPEETSSSSKGVAGKKRTNKNTDHSSRKKAKKDGNTVKKLIRELTSNNDPEETTSATSYSVTPTETDPEPIDFLDLYHKISTAEHDAQKPNQFVIVQYYNFGRAQAKRFKFFYEQSYNVQDANSEVKKEIVKQLPDGTPETTIRKRTERARKIFHLFSKIGKDKIGQVKDFTALMISKLTVDQINYIVDNVPDKNPSDILS